VPQPITVDNEGSDDLLGREKPSSQPEAHPTRLRVWKRPGSIGDVEAIKGIGGVVAPLLAGFCLATVAVLMTSSESKTPQARAAVVCLAIAAVAFLYAMQYSFVAVRNGSPPSAYIDWDPYCTIHPRLLTAVREEQADDRRDFVKYDDRAGWFYNLALLLFLAGLALVIVPTQWQPWNGIPLAVIATAFILELGSWLGSTYRRLKATRNAQAVGVSRVDEIPTDHLKRLGLLR
jgi:hypothetical protein